ncbi:MAG: hypothetical protein ACLRLE_03760 [Turicibacter sp.]|uniref:hypothetical protein n=1 Tax=Turicibacter sp. GALT-G1 TaxID=2951140 RepID=UPI0021D4D9F5|nr:hypothetical protein [Turicibacter sp. GALT-G1]MCU7206580.1 hypothetical protein [Turicibacter sp. GALT-G1]
MSQIKLNISQSRGYEAYQLTQSKAYRNLFVTLKLRLKLRYQEMDQWRQQIKATQENIETLEGEKAQLLKDNNKIFNCNSLFTLKKELSTHYATLRELENLVAGTEENIKVLECGMFDMVQLGDNHLSTHQKIQLLGGGVDKAREIIKTLMEMEKLSSIEEVRFIDLVMHHTEYQWNKQRAEWWIDCEIWEMPVFQACMEEMIRRTHDYEEQTGRCLMTEVLEEHAKENGKKLVPLQTEHGVVMTFEEDIQSKYERHGKVMKLKSGGSVTIHKKTNGF